MLQTNINLTRFFRLKLGLILSPSETHYLPGKATCNQIVTRVTLHYRKVQSYNEHNEIV